MNAGKQKRSMKRTVLIAAACVIALIALDEAKFRYETRNVSHERLEQMQAQINSWRAAAEVQLGNLIDCTASAHGDAEKRRSCLLRTMQQVSDPGAAIAASIYAQSILMANPDDDEVRSQTLAMLERAKADTNSEEKTLFYRDFNQFASAMNGSLIRRVLSSKTHIVEPVGLVKALEEVKRAISEKSELCQTSHC